MCSTKELIHHKGFATVMKVLWMCILKQDNNYFCIYIKLATQRTVYSKNYYYELLIMSFFFENQKIC